LRKFAIILNRAVPISLRSWDASTVLIEPNVANYTVSKIFDVSTRALRPPRASIVDKGFAGSNHIFIGVGKVVADPFDVMPVPIVGSLLLVIN